MQKKQTITLVLILTLILVFLIVIFLNSSDKPKEKILSKSQITEDGQVQTDLEVDTSQWRTARLKNVSTGREFSINDFKGKVVLLESFAVWCPTCLKQQKELQKLKIAKGDEIIHISLDTDPNEDEDKIKEHLGRHGFDWFFAITPKNVTKSLIDDFGINIVNAPGSPIILICPDQSTTFLKRGVKTSEELQEEINKTCS